MLTYESANNKKLKLSKHSGIEWYKLKVFNNHNLLNNQTYPHMFVEKCLLNSMNFFFNWHITSETDVNGNCQLKLKQI